MKVKTIDFQAWARDCHNYTLYGADGEELFEHEGYNDLGRIGRGDSTDLRIDNATGTIIGWKPILDADLEDMIDG